MELYDTPIKAIRKKCLDCCCGQVKEVRLCEAINCSLYPYRMGHRPNEGTLLSIKEYYGINDGQEGEFLTKTGTVELNER